MTAGRRPRLLVTGATGYIGARLATLAQRSGCDVVVLGSPPPGVTVSAYSWRLGDEPPPAALTGADALVHLGHSWRSGDTDLNLAGTEQLARAALASGRARFVFASTTSARAEALNRYGRIKQATEQRLLGLPGAAGRIWIARIGLVYGGPESGQYALMSKLADLSPVLPMIGLSRRVQPIHVDEVCTALLRLALDPPGDHSTYVVAGPDPMTFGHWLRTLRLTRTGKGLALIPVPTGLALLACDLTRILPFVPTVDRERVLGLAGTAPMPSAADLAALGISPVDPAVRLAAEPAARRHLLAEAAAMLCYVSGASSRSPGPLIRLARALAREEPAVRQPLPAFVLRWPSLMRLIEPWRPSTAHGLSRRLHLAAMVAESQPNAGSREPASVMRLLGLLILEVLAFPIRLLCSRIFA